MHFVDVIVFARTKVDAVVSEIKKIVKNGTRTKVDAAVSEFVTNGTHTGSEIKKLSRMLFEPMPFRTST
jgi:DNA-binding transcriptional regulator YhcF (GntR family)